MANNPNSIALPNGCEPWPGETGYDATPTLRCALCNGLGNIMCSPRVLPPDSLEPNFTAPATICPRCKGSGIDPECTREEIGRGFRNAATMTISQKRPIRKRRDHTCDIVEMFTGLPIIAIDSPDIKIPAITMEVRINGSWFIRANGIQAAISDQNWQADPEKMHLA